MTTLKIEDVENMMEVVLRGLKDVQFSSFQVDHDHYWDLAPEQAFDVINVPNPEIFAGQLSSDIQDLGTVCSDPERFIPFHLQCLASVLRYLSYRLKP